MTHDAPTGSAAAVEANKELVRLFHAAMNGGSLDEALDFWSPTAINHASGRSGQQIPGGREGLRRVFQGLRAAFPDRLWQVDDLIAEGDRVACLITVSGTFAGLADPPPGVPSDWVGIEGTEFARGSDSGKTYSVKHIHVFRISAGKISEHWAARDDLSLLLQLGAIKPPVRPDNKSAQTT